MKRRFTILTAALALLTFLAVPMGMRGQTTYQLQQVTSVEVGGLYVFEQGGHVMNNTVSSSALQTTNTYSTTGLNGTETYVWTLETATDGFYLKNVSLNSSQYLNNSSSTSVSFGNKSSIWNFNFQTDQTVLIQNKSNSNRFLGYTNSTSYAYKAYATNNLDSYSHAIKVYQLVEEGSTPTTYSVTFDAGEGTFVGNTDFPSTSNTVAAGTYTLPSATPATGYTFDGWVATGITTPITGSYTVSGAVAFTAHYTQSGSSGQIATLTATNLDLETSYPSSEQTVTIDGITYAYHYLMKSSTNIQAQATNGVIRNTTAYSEDIVSVAITHSSTARATTIWGSANGENWTSVATGSGSITADFSGKGYKYFKITRGSNAAYWTQIVITCEAASSVAKPTFNPAGGIYTSAQSVTISAESGVNIYYTTDGSQPTTNSTLYNGAISIESTTTLKAIAVVNGESSNVTSATYTIVTPLTTMQAIFDNATVTPASHEVAITFGNWVISGQNGSQLTGASANRAWLTDNNGKGCLIYDSNNPNLMAGNVLNGTVICNLQLYNGSAQITGVNSTTTDINGNTIVSTEGTITPVETTIGNLSGVSTGAVVKLNHLRCTSAGTISNTLTDGTNTIYAKKTLYSSLSFEEGKIYDLTGVFEYSSSTSTIYPRSEADVVEAPKATLTIGNLANVTGLYVFYDYDENNPIISEGQSSAQQQVYIGEEIVVSPEVAAHCAMQSLTVTDGEDNPVSVTDHMADGNYYSFVMPSSGATIAATASVAQQYTLTVVGDHVSITQLLVGEESDIVSLDANNQASIYEQAEVVVDGLTVDAAYMIESVTIEYGNTSVEVTKNSGGLYAFTMPSSNATLTFTVGEKPTYTLVTSEDQLVPGKHYIIVGSKTASGSTKHYAMGLQNSNNRKAVEVTISNNTIEAVEGIYEFVISGPETINKDDQDVIVYTIFDAKESGYLCATSSSDNYLKTESNLNNNGKWTITIGATTHVATITAQGDKTRNKLKKNNSNDIFSCYSSGQNDVYLYVKDGDNNCHIYSNTNLSSDMTVAGDMNIHAGVVTVKEDAVLTVNGTLTNNGTAANLIIEDGGQLITNYSVAATVQKLVKSFDDDMEGGWKFIASPVQSISINDVSNLISEKARLYKYDEPTYFWRYYSGTGAPFTTLTNQVGYLYGNENDVTLSFAGTITPSSSEVSIENLSYTTDNPLAGWNLVGNPFTCNAYTNKSYYVTSYDPYEPNKTVLGEYLASQNVPIPPCTGILVQADSEDKTISFANSSYNIVAKNGMMQVMVSQANMRGSSMVDKAIVSFNAGDELGKFVFNADAAELYIPQDGKDYAIVSSEAQGEMPVNFKAKENGNYTLSINVEGMEMNYLHLIDNKTGNDVDLLQTPSYSFEAKTTDYESRFKLVFVANNEDSVSTGSETFAFFSNGSFVINNEGNAELQVIDITGRIVKSESINGCANVNVNAAPGVYMLRLVNGDNVKTQKVVVK